MEQIKKILPYIGVGFFTLIALISLTASYENTVSYNNAQLSASLLSIASNASNQVEPIKAETFFCLETGYFCDGETSVRCNDISDGTQMPNYQVISKIDCGSNSQYCHADSDRCQDTPDLEVCANQKEGWFCDGEVSKRCENLANQGEPGKLLVVEETDCANSAGSFCLDSFNGQCASVNQNTGDYPCHRCSESRGCLAAKWMNAASSANCNDVKPVDITGQEGDNELIQYYVEPTCGAKERGDDRACM